MTKLESLASCSQSEHLLLLESGMYWVWFPWASGKYLEDTLKAKEMTSDNH